ncbi:MAG: L-ribulose-5-phosphate 4-epimerase [Chloroflexota bacterium]|nr:L-ribulose-5-phosphate 4-epimerase [Chloroflexota bacterium]
MIDREFREDFLSVALDFEQSPLTGFGPTKGSLSARDLESGHVLITPSGLKISSLQPEDLLVVDLQGKVLAGEKKPSLDLIFHLAVYQARSDVGGIVHTHSPYATAYACMGKPVQPLIMALVITAGGSVDVAPFAFPGTPELGQSIVSSLGNKQAVLMEKHGVLSVGKNLRAALNVAGTVENVAQIQYLVEGQGSFVPLDEETIRRGIEFEKGYGQG